MLYYLRLPANKSGPTPVTLESLATLIARSAVSTDEKFTALADDISSVKDDISGVTGEIADLSMSTPGEF
jgi:hypothetical protein